MRGTIRATVTLETTGGISINFHSDRRGLGSMVGYTGWRVRGMMMMLMIMMMMMMMIMTII